MNFGRSLRGGDSLAKLFDSRSRTISANRHMKPTYLFPSTLVFSDIDSRMALNVQLRLDRAVDGLAEELSVDIDLLTEFDLDQNHAWINDTTYELTISGQNFYEVFTEVHCIRVIGKIY